MQNKPNLLDDGFLQMRFFAALRMTKVYLKYSLSISLATGGQPGTNIPQSLCLAVQLPIHNVPVGSSSWPLPMAMIMFLSSGTFLRNCSPCRCRNINRVDWQALQDCTSKIVKPGNSTESLIGGGAKGS